MVSVRCWCRWLRHGVLIEEYMEKLSFDDGQFKMMEKIKHRMNYKTATRRQGQAGILTIVPSVVGVEGKMIDIEETASTKTGSKLR